MCSHLRAFTLAVPSAWYTLPSDICTAASLKCHRLRKGSPHLLHFLSSKVLRYFTHLSCFCLSPLGYKLQDGRSCLSSSLLYPQHLEQGLAHSRCSENVCGVNLSLLIRSKFCHRITELGSPLEAFDPMLLFYRWETEAQRRA